MSTIWQPAMNWQTFTPADEATVARLRRRLVGNAPFVLIRSKTMAPKLPPKGDGFRSER